MRAMVARIFSSKRRLISRLPATSRSADQAEWPAALSKVSAIQAFRLFPSDRAATVAARCTVGETLSGILPENGRRVAYPPGARSLVGRIRFEKPRHDWSMSLCHDYPITSGGNRIAFVSHSTCCCSPLPSRPRVGQTHEGV